MNNRKTRASRLSWTLMALAFLTYSQPISANEYSEPQERAGELLAEIGKLDGTTFQGSGLLKQSFIQFDEDNISYLLQIGNKRYPTRLDDGRGTSKRAEECEKAEFIGLNPTKGCPITFEAEYNIDVTDRGAEISLTIWNVDFK